MLRLTLFALLLSGCGPTPAAQVREDAAEEFQCEGDHIDIRRRNDDTWIAMGCQRQGVFQCNTSRGEIRCINLAGLARDRAGREWGCNTDDILLDEVSPYVFRVMGCGQESTFHCVVEHGRARCIRDTTRPPEPDPDEGGGE